MASFYGSEKEIGLVEGNMQEGNDEAVQNVVPLLNGEKLKAKGYDFRVLSNFICRKGSLFLKFHGAVQSCFVYDLYKC